MRKSTVLLFLFCFLTGLVAFSVDVCIVHASETPILIIGAFTLIGAFFATINEMPTQ